MSYIVYIVFFFFIPKINRFSCLNGPQTAFCICVLRNDRSQRNWGKTKTSEHRDRLKFTQKSLLNAFKFHGEKKRINKSYNNCYSWVLEFSRYHSGAGVKVDLSGSLKIRIWNYGNLETERVNSRGVSTPLSRVGIVMILRARDRSTYRDRESVNGARRACCRPNGAAAERKILFIIQTVLSLVYAKWSGFVGYDLYGFISSSIYYFCNSYRWIIIILQSNTVSRNISISIHYVKRGTATKYPGRTP